MAQFFKGLLCLGFISLASAWELWWSVEGTKFGFDEIFRWNLKKEKQKEDNPEPKKQLIEYLRFNKMAKLQLNYHNMKTNFFPKHLEQRVIIPYTTHQIWISDINNPVYLNQPNIWHMVSKMGEEITEGVEWKHIFWTNDKSLIKVNNTACEGRCEVRLIETIPGYQEIEDLVEQMIKNNLFRIDLLKPMILYHYGGLYLDADFNYERSVKFLHRVMDLYTGFEGLNWPGIAPGIIAARPKHQAIDDWKNFILQYYGFRDDVLGTQDVMPMPTFKEDIFATSGPRALTFGVWNNLNKWGNNDAIFKTSMIALDVTHGAFKQQTRTGQIIDDNPQHESIKIGGKIFEFERFGHYRFERAFGFRTSSGEWHVPEQLMWKLPDGHEEAQLWLVDFTDRKNIMSPNLVSNATFKEERSKWKGKVLTQKIIFDKWLATYFKSYQGKYIDRLLEYDENVYKQVNQQNKSQEKQPVKDEL